MKLETPCIANICTRGLKLHVNAVIRECRMQVYMPTQGFIVNCEFDRMMVGACDYIAFEGGVTQRVDAEHPEGLGNFLTSYSWSAV